MSGMGEASGASGGVVTLVCDSWKSANAPKSTGLQLGLSSVLMMNLALINLRVSDTTHDTRHTQHGTAHAAHAAHTF